jgi:hypothetical protein
MHIRRILVSVAALVALTVLSGCEALQQLQGQLGS